MPDIHAKLSASGAKRWMACPRSVALEEQFPEKDTEYSTEGTEAHSLAEKLLRKFKETGQRVFTDEELGTTNRDMILAVSDYMDYVYELYDGLALQYKDVAIYVETIVKFDKYVPEGFGTCDCIIIADQILHVVDYKHGKGVKVFARENPQPRLYGLGALEMFEWQYPIKWIQMHIVQPRIGHADVETLAVETLKAWGEDEVKPKAQRAFENKGDFVPGDHCQFCKAKPVCKARALKSLGVIQNIMTKKEGGK